MLGNGACYSSYEELGRQIGIRAELAEETCERLAELYLIRVTRRTPDDYYDGDGSDDVMANDLFIDFDPEPMKELAAERKRQDSVQIEDTGPAN